MIRKLMVTLGVAACGLAVGCGGSSGSGGSKPTGDKNALDKITEGANKATDAATAAAKGAADTVKDKLAKGKEELLKNLGMPDTKAIEDKINGLTGDAKTEASGVYEQIKKMLADFSTSDKLDGWKEKFEPLIKKLKDMLKL